MSKRSLLRRASFLMLLFSSSLLAADHCNDSDPCDDCRDSCSDCYKPSKVSCDPCDNCCEHEFFIESEYLFWRTWQDGLDIAGKGLIYPGTIDTLEYDWSHGFRVGLGYKNPSSWSLAAKYTWLRPEGTQKISGDEIFPTFTPLFVAGGWTGGTLETAESQFTSARSKIKFDYNVLDIELSKHLCFDPCFEFQLLTGVQAAYTEQKLDLDYMGTLVIDIDTAAGPPSQEFAPFIINEMNRWKFYGAGLKLGAAGQYLSGCGFLIQSRADFAILYGKYENHFDRTIPLLEQTTTIPGFLEVFEEYYLISGKENFYDFTSNIHLQFALGWETRCWDCITGRLTAGWEMVYWIDMAQFRRGLTGQGASTDRAINPFDFHFAGTNATDKVARNVGLQGLVISLEIIY